MLKAYFSLCSYTIWYRVHDLLFLIHNSIQSTTESRTSFEMINYLHALGDTYVVVMISFNSFCILVANSIRHLFEMSCIVLMR